MCALPAENGTFIPLVHAYEGMTLCRIFDSRGESSEVAHVEPMYQTYICMIELCKQHK